MRILILGGTREASEFVRRISGDPRFDPVLSLAGRTTAPAIPAVALRSGGFGGADGLTRWVQDNGIEVIVDATHPFATGISANAVTAAKRAHVPLVSLKRAPWEQQPGDIWTGVDNAERAAAALGREPRRVFLAIGRQEIGAFHASPQHHYLIRSIEPPAQGNVPPRAQVLLQRGPFALDAEIALMRAYAIEIVVAKNSGAAATYAKIAAAHTLALPVVMIAQPPKASGGLAGDAAFVYERLVELARDHVTAPSERGV